MSLMHPSRPAADIQTTGKRSALPAAAIDAGKHRHADPFEKGDGLGLLPPRLLVSEYDVGDGELAAPANREQFRGRGERIRLTNVAAGPSVRLFFAVEDDGAASNGVVLLDKSRRLSERGRARMTAASVA